MDGAQRYALIDNTSSAILYQHLAVAWRPTPRVAIGVGVQNMYAAVESSSMGSSWVGIWGEPEDQDLDLLIRIRGEDALTITGNVGVWAEPVDGLELGASFQLPAKVHDEEASLEVRLPTHYSFDPAAIEGDTMELALDFPWIARVGVRYAMKEVFDVELDATYERWSVHDAIRSTPDNVRVTGVPTVGTLEVGALTLDRSFDDVFSVHLGGEWHVLPQYLSVRGGFFFETGAIPDETYSMFQIDSDKAAPTVGLSAFFDGWRVDAAYTHIFQVAREITTSEVSQINPTYNEGATIVANGSYTSGYDIVGLGAGVTF